MTPPMNGTPVIPGLTIEQAEALRSWKLRPSYVQRNPGPGSPMRVIKDVLHATGDHGRMVRLVCGHYRDIREYDLHNKPKSARCGCCKLGYEPPDVEPPEDPS
jgi:hypothetical protein